MDMDRQQIPQRGVTCDLFDSVAWLGKFVWISSVNGRLTDCSHGYTDKYRCTLPTHMNAASDVPSPHVTNARRILCIQSITIAGWLLTGFQIIQWTTYPFLPPGLGVIKVIRCYLSEEMSLFRPRLYNCRGQPEVTLAVDRAQKTKLKSAVKCRTWVTINIRSISWYFHHC